LLAVSTEPTTLIPVDDPTGPPRRITLAHVTPRAVLTIVGLVVAAAVTLWILWLSRRILTWVIIAIFLAVALNPIVDALQRWLRLRRVLAISVTFLLGLAVTTGILLLFVPPLIDGGQQLADDAPGYLDRLGRTRLVQDLDQRYDVIVRLKDYVKQIPNKLGGAGAAVDVAQSLLSGLLGALTVLVLTFLFLVYGRQFHARGIELLPADKRERAEGLLDRMYKSVGGYVAGNLLVSIIAGVAAFIVLKILGIPAAVALAFWVGIADLVPLVGATIGAIPAIAVAFFSGWRIGLVVTIYFVVYQQIENHFVQPVVMRRTASLNPLVVLVAVLLGAQLLGVLGALLAIPAASIIKILLHDWWSYRHPAPPEAQSPVDPPDTPLENPVTA
jgi:predicted PurR-regulated permease PerM